MAKAILEPVTYRVVPPTLGKGRVALYDLAAGVPELLEPMTAKQCKATPWVLVHLPSRRHHAVKTKAEGIEILRAIHKGSDPAGLVPSAKGKGKVETKGKPNKSKKPTPAPARAPAREEVPPAAPVPPPSPTPPDQSSEAPLDEDAPTPVPPGATFDQAMQLVFPAGRLTAELERLLRFKKKIVTREGDEIGEEDEPFVQLNAAKLIITYHQGRAPEKEKPAPEKKRISYDELKSMVLTSEAALQYMEQLVRSARAARTDATTPAPPAP